MSIIVCAGGMRSGKTDDAVNIINAYENFGLRVKLFQPEKNVRDVIDYKPVWRSGSGKFIRRYLPAEWYSSADTILSSMDDYDVFGFEEHHWYPSDYIGLVKKLDLLGKIVVDVGLDFFHNGKPVPQFAELAALKNVELRSGVAAFCDIDLKKGKYTLARRTQMIIDGEYPYYDSPIDVAENPGDRFGGASTRVQHEYFPVSIENWQIKPPRDISLAEEYKQYFSSIKCQS